MNGVSHYRTGLDIFRKLMTGEEGLASGNVCAIPGKRCLKATARCLSATMYSLGAEGVRFDEVVERRVARGRIVWKPGPRIRQAI